MSNNMLLFFLFLSINALWIPEIHSKSHGFFNYSSKGIIGGKNTTIEQHPFQVAVFLGETFGGFCGGSIISPRYILTAAHCVYDFSVTVAHVRVGSTYANRGGTVYTSKQIFSHPLYDRNTIDYDVGLIDLGTNINLDGKNSKTIGLPPSGAAVQPGINVVVTGWGLTKEGDQDSASMQLMEVTVPTISNADCSKYYYDDGTNITERMMCAGLPQGGKGPCFGDSGGPAVDLSSGVQLGVVSWGGGGCARPFYPAVYANLSNIEIRNWIKNVTGI